MSIPAMPADPALIAKTWGAFLTSGAFATELMHAVRDQRVAEIRAELADGWELYARRQRPSVEAKSHWDVIERLLQLADIAASRHRPPAELAELFRRIDPRCVLDDAVMQQAADLDHETWARFLRRQLERVTWPPLLCAASAWDFVAHVMGAPRPVSGPAAKIGVLLVPVHGGRGIVAWLTLERLDDEGRGHVYPSRVFNSVLACGPAFEQAIDDAVACLRRASVWPAPCPFDVRWTLVRADRALLDAIDGPSAGLAFGLGLGKVVAPTSDTPNELATALMALDLGGLATSATLSPDGRIGIIGEEFSKLREAARGGSWVRIHTVLLAEGQPVDPGMIAKAGVHVDPGGGFEVLARPAFGDAVLDAVRIGGSRRAGIDCDVPPRDPEYIGREALMARLQTFIDSKNSGALVIVGDMGRGKSAFLAEWLHRERARGEDPIFHFVGAHNSTAADPDTIAKCLWTRLALKHPVKPGDRIGSDTERLGLVLDEVSARCVSAGRREVIYLDAADQVSLRNAERLITRVLGPPRPGILCVVTTTRADVCVDGGWPASIAAFDEYVDDRVDIAAFVHRQARSITPPLETPFIQRIVSQPPAPVFFTVVECVATLRTSVDEALTRRLRTEVEPWLETPEALITKHAGKAEADAANDGLSQAQLWNVLGTIAIARDQLTPDQLRALGLWDEAITERALRIASAFFRPRPARRSPMVPYAFRHPGYQREILRTHEPYLSPAEVTALHGAFASGCQRVLQVDQRESRSRDYALRHGVGHLIQAEQWQDVANAFADDHLVVERCQRFGFVTVFRDAQAAAEHSRLPEGCKAGWTSFAAFLRARFWALGPYPEYYAQELVNEFLPVASESLKSAFLQLSTDRRAGSTPRFLKARGAPALRGAGHHDGVVMLAWSPDGRWVASGSFDKMVRVWEAATGALVATAGGHTGRVSSVAWSPDGRWVASGSNDCTVRVWEAATGAPVAMTEGHLGAVSSVAWSPDGRWVASGSQDRTVRVWEAATGALVATAEGHTGYVRSVAWSPDGRWLASGSDDCTVRVWEASTRGLVATSEGHTGHVWSVAWSPDGRWVASGSDDCTVRVWEAATGAPVAMAEGHYGAVSSVAWSPDGRWVASGSQDRTVRVWEAATGALVATADHTGYVWSVAWSPDGRWVASGSQDRTVRVWQALTGALVATADGHAGQVRSVAWSPDGRWVASGSHDRTVRVWEASTGGLVATTSSQAVFPRRLAWSPDGRWVAAWSNDETAKSGTAWSKDGTKHFLVEVRDVATGILVSIDGGHTGRVAHVEWSPDGRWLASGDDCGAVRVWEAATGGLVAAAAGNAGGIFSVAWSPDGRWLASSSLDCLTVWEARTGAFVARADTMGVFVVKWSPDGRWVASGSQDRTVRVWDARTGTLMATGKGHADRVMAVAWSQDGRWVASGSGDRTVRVWEPSTGRLAATAEGHTGEVTSVAWSADGGWLASGSDDRTVRVWDGITGRQLNALFFENPIIAVEVVGSNPAQLLVADVTWEVLAYEVHGARHSPRRS